MVEGDKTTRDWERKGSVLSMLLFGCSSKLVTKDRVMVRVYLVSI